MTKKKLGHEFVSKGVGEDGRERFDVVITSRHNLMKFARDKREQNAAFIKEDGEMVWTPFGRAKLDPEYIQRNEVTKKLKKQIEKYSGSKEMASDYVFAMKKEAESQGEDFVEKAKETVLANESHNPQPVTEIKVSPPKKKSFFMEVIERVFPRLKGNAEKGESMENYSYLKVQEMKRNQEKP